MTILFLNSTHESIEQTSNENEVVINVSNLMSLYQEKYLSIPEYILDANNERLLSYLQLSDRFVDSADLLNQYLTTPEQVQLFHQIIENNHTLDEYFFSQIVPNVKNINTSKFLELQETAGQYKESTMKLVDELKQAATDSNRRSIDKSQDNIFNTIQTLVISIVVSLFVSIVLMVQVTRSIRIRLDQVIVASNAIANGDLSVAELDDRSTNEIGRLSHSVNHMKRSLSEMIDEIAGLSKRVGKEATDLTTNSNQTQEQSEKVAVTIEQMATGSNHLAQEANTIMENLKEFYQKIMEAKSNGDKLVHFSLEVMHVSAEGNSHMQESLGQMNTINENVQQSVLKISELEKKTLVIADFVDVIRSIADQTNLLALNASIEAARAGESGRGFAVVANEVRSLAEQANASSDSIKRTVDEINAEISKLTKELHESFQEVHKGKTQIETTGHYFDNINDKVRTMSNRIEEISTTMTFLEQTSVQINHSVEHIAAISEQSAAGSEEISVAATEQSHAILQVSTGAKELWQLVERMNKLITRFHI
ncbi:methyl-accepting chemotaxis protein [Paenibacillus xanthanilyticus]